MWKFRSEPIVPLLARVVCCRLWLAGSMAVMLALPAGVFAQEVSGLQAAVALEQALVRTIARAEHSVVSIARYKRPGDDSGREVRSEIFPAFNPPIITAAPDPTDPDFVPNEFATGVVIDASGLILTNFHVIDRDSEHYVTTIDRKVFKTKIKAADPRSDLAVLQVVDQPAASDFVPIKFGNARLLKKGQIVIALGNPYAIARDGQVSASWGIVSNLARKVGARSGEEEATLHQFGTLIQTDAKLNLGTSGGALLNLNGEMIGLTTSLAATSGYEQAAGYAIPIDDNFLRVIETLKKGREVEYGFLGVQPANLSGHDLLAGKHGMRVDMVSPATPAKQADIKPGDFITHVNGQPLHDADGLRLHVGVLPALSVVTLTIERAIDRQDQTLVKDVVLSKFRVKGKKIATVREPDWRGLRVDFPSAVITPLGLDESLEAALAVSEVAEDSPAFRAGLRTGMLITHVGTTHIGTPADFRREVAGRQGEVSLKLAVGPGEFHTVKVPAE